MKLKLRKSKNFDRVGIQQVTSGTGNSDWDQKIRRRFVDYIFQPPAHAERIRRLSQVMAHLELAWYQDRATKDNSDELIYDIWEEVFKRDLLEPFILTIERSALAPEGVAKSFVDTIVSGDMSDLEPAGLNWFGVGFYRYVGQTLERSMQYALFLMEHIARGAKLAMTVPIDRESEVEFDELSRYAFTTIIVSASLAPHPDLPQKRWIECLIEHLEEPAVGDVLGNILDVLRTGQADNLLTVCKVPAHLTKDMLFETATEGFRASTARFADTVLTPTLLLSEKHEGIFRQHQAPLAAYHEDRKRRGEEQIAWVREHAESVIDHLERELKRAEESPCRGIRPGGFDYVEIRVIALQNAGIRGIVFHPESRPFLDPVVEILFRKETPHLLSFRMPLEEVEQFDIRVLENGTHHDLKSLVTLLFMTVADSFCRMVLDERPLREKKDSEKASPSGSETRKPKPPRFRRLPLGWNASEEARQRGEAYFGYLPPQGSTFVRADFRNGQLEYDLPTTPFAEYGDDDLFDLKRGVP